MKGLNIVLEAGLYNGARGTVVGIVYDTIAGPNNQHKDHLPLYIVVGFPGLRLRHVKGWDKNNQTVSKGNIKPTY